MQNITEPSATKGFNFDTFCEHLSIALSRSIRRHPALSRELLADELAAKTGRRVTPYTIHSWTSRCGKHAWLPLAFAVLTCELLDDFSLFAVALGPHAQRVAQLVLEGKGSAPEKKRRK